MKIYMFIVMFLLIGAFFIVSENKLPISTNEGAFKFVSLYSNWLVSVSFNSVKTVGYAVKMDWLPSPSLNSTG